MGNDHKVEKEEYLEQLRDEIEQKEAYIRNLQSENERLTQELQKYTIKTYRFDEQELDIKEQELNIREREIEAIDQELEDIKNSRMYHLMRFFCNAVDGVRAFPETLTDKVRAFIRMMGHVNVQELKIAFGYVMNEGVVEAYRHLMRDYHQGELKKIQLNVKIYEEFDNIDDYAEIAFPYAENPMVSIIIPVYNQFAYTYYCLKAILENSGDIAYEIIVADDCSTDKTVDIKRIVKNIKVVRTATNLFFLRNCNHAAQYAKGKYLLFLNNDTQVQKNWLQPLVDLCERDATIGMTGSKLVYGNGILQEAGGVVWRDGSGLNYGRNDDAMKPEYNYVRDVDYISGAAIMIRRALWEQLGGFDELFVPAYCEDSDLAFQVRSAGFRVVYQPLSVVVHFEGKSNGTDIKSGVKKYQIENSAKLRKKWKKVLSCQYKNGQMVFKARERSQGKKTVLFIDHYVPQFDKDAGSKTIYQYLKMFVEKGYSVKFIGDNYYQQEPYTTVLQQMGIEVLYGTWYAENWKTWLERNHRYIDFVFLNRPHITIKYIDFLRTKTKIKCIYYGHDLHFLRLKREYELSGNSEKLKESEEWKEKELYIMRNADISYYPSYVEIEEIHKIDSSIPVKAITAYAYENFRENIPSDFTKREGIMFVGGFGHPPNEDAVLWFAKEIYPFICEKQKIPFYIVGSNPTSKVTALNGNGITVKGFVTEEELQSLYDSCRMVVIPLRYGAGVKGKVVEALYYGTPMVTTSVGAEGIEGIEQIVEVADGSKEFADAVISLYHDTEKLSRTVEEYQQFVKKKFSVDAVWSVIKDDFQ